MRANFDAITQDFYNLVDRILVKIQSPDFGFWIQNKTSSNSLIFLHRSDDTTHKTMSQFATNQFGAGSNQFGAGSCPPGHSLMSVQCPQNVYAGQPLQIQTPSGLMRITVPQGVSPGMTFQIAVPSTQPTPVVVPMTMPMANPNAIAQQQREMNFYQQQQALAQQQQFQPQQPQQPQKVQKSVQVTIPKGVRPGNKITINLPDGRQVQITVPKGMRPGNKMTVNCTLLIFSPLLFFSPKIYSFLFFSFVLLVLFDPDKAAITLYFF